MSKNDKSRDMVFAAFYVGEAGFNATKAAELTGIQAKNQHSLNTIASQMLRKPEVQEYIRNHVEKAAVTQDKILAEMAKLAFWDHEANHPANAQLGVGGETLTPTAYGMEEAKVFDTMMRGKIKCLSDLMKVYSGDLAKELEKVRKTIAEHREQFPDMTEAERGELFKKHVDPKMVEQVMAELLKSDENRKRLEEIEAEDEETTSEVVLDKQRKRRT